MLDTFTRHWKAFFDDASFKALQRNVKCALVFKSHSFSHYDIIYFGAFLAKLF